MAAFSRIYIEEEAIGYPLAQRILEKLPKARRVMIRHYKDVFNRPRQDFSAQKGARQLILAVKRPPYVYPLSPLCETYGHEKAFYTTPVLNCPYDCDFCFLQGVYPSAYLVVFVNDGDFFAAAEAQEGPFFLSITYENDLMALEGLVPWTARWLDFAQTTPRMEMEVRTRSANVHALAGRKGLSNVVLAWSLSPEKVSVRYEKSAPSPAQRLQAAKTALTAGWRVRLCVEPIIRVPGWEEAYRALIDEAFRVLPPDRLDSAVADVFRMGWEGFERIRKAREDTDLFAFRPQKAGNSATYPQYREMGQTVREMIEKYMPKDRVYGGVW